MFQIMEPSVSILGAMYKIIPETISQEVNADGRITWMNYYITLQMRELDRIILKTFRLSMRSLDFPRKYKKLHSSQTYTPPRPVTGIALTF
jgi:hypothetical protein